MIQSWVLNLCFEGKTKLDKWLVLEKKERTIDGEATQRIHYLKHTLRKNLPFKKTKSHQRHKCKWVKHNAGGGINFTQNERWLFPNTRVEQSRRIHS